MKNIALELAVKQVLRMGLAGLLLLGGSQSRADVIGPASLSGSVSGVVQPVTSFGTYSYSGTLNGFSGTVSDSLTASGFPSPGLSASAGGLTVSSGGSVNARLDYSFEVINTNPAATGTSIPVKMTYSLFGAGLLGVNSPAAFYDASFGIGVSSRSGSLLTDSYQIGGSGNNSASGPCSVLHNRVLVSSGCGSVDIENAFAYFDVAPNTTYFTDIQLNLTASGALVKAIVDPYIQIDPTFTNASAYSVIVSSNVGNAPPTTPTAPEPATLVLAAAAIAAILLARRRNTGSLRFRRF
jgi:hypothetical protein